MQWLYRIHPSRPGMPEEPTPEEERLVGEHFAYLVRLRDEGRLLLAGRTQEADTFGIAIYEAADAAEADAVMRADPAIAAGVFTATLHPFAVAVAADRLGDGPAS